MLPKVGWAKGIPFPMLGRLAYLDALNVDCRSAIHGDRLSLDQIAEWA